MPGTNPDGDCLGIVAHLGTLPLCLGQPYSYNPFAASQRSASRAAMQPLPAAVTAWR